MSEHTPLWDNERIINATNNASNVWEARHLYDAMVKVRDDYQAELATLRARIEEATDANTSCARYIAGQMERIEELEAQLAAAWEPVPDDVREAMNLLLISVEYFAEHGDFYKYGHMTQPASIVRQWFDALPPA
jgi:hypothetical protein